MKRHIWQGIKLVLVLIVIVFVIWAVKLDCENLQAETMKIKGTTNIDDTFLYEGHANYNCGGHIRVYVYLDTGTPWSQHTLIRVKNLSALLPANATITSCVCSLYCWAYDSEDTSYISAYRVFKPWIEGTQMYPTWPDSGANWDDWALWDYEWGGAGCSAAYDTGHDNSGDGVNSDRKATAECTIAVTDTGQWYGFPVSTALAQGWYDGTINEEGIILIGTVELEDREFWSTEYTTDTTLCPVWDITYTVGTKLLPIKK